MKQKFILDAGVINLHHLKKKKVMKKIEVRQYKIGNYEHYSFLFHNKDSLAYVFSNVLKGFFKKIHKSGTILVIGLGNSSILGDSFGVKVVNGLIASNQYNDFLTVPKVALFCPETVNKTGISSFKLIEMVVHLLKPDVILLIDSFVTEEEKYLDNSLEINNHGIVFADELRSNRVIDENTFNIPVLSIGYTTMLLSHNRYLTCFKLMEDMEFMSTLVSHTLNKIIFS